MVNITQAYLEQARLVKALWRRVMLTKINGILGKIVLLRRCLTMRPCITVEPLASGVYIKFLVFSDLFVFSLFLMISYGLTKKNLKIRFRKGFRNSP